MTFLKANNKFQADFPKKLANQKKNSKFTPSLNKTFMQLQNNTYWWHNSKPSYLRM